MKKKILLVEDEKDLSDIIKAFLVKWNFEVSVAYDGKEALEKVKEKPNLVLLDLMLPKLDGREVLKRIKNDPELKHIPVVVLTARSESKVIFEVMESGSFDYLIKPFDNKELFDTITRAL